MSERDVFIAALQLESRAERQAYLEDVCGDEALRHQVAALLATHDRAGNFLQEPLLIPIEVAAALREQLARAPLAENAVPGTGSDAQQSAQTPVEAGDAASSWLRVLAAPQQPDELGRLGYYRVLRLLGHGGMGVVFLADDPRLQRQVALKVMRPELAVNPEGRQRFLRKARAAAKVRSDHVVTIYHVDQEGDLAYLVMELLRGQSLAETLEQSGRLPLGLCLRIARETAEGLAAAHACGLIHRDVKPGNIFLEVVSGGVVSGNDKDHAPRTTHHSPKIKLLDFGLALTPTGPPITQRQVIVGTPGYMSPEQAAAGPLDGRSDLFSLGAVLYHALTGQRPFPGADLMAVLSSLANATPPSAASLVPDLPLEVADLLDRLLAKDPADRPKSAADVARTLLALEKKAVDAPPTSGPQSLVGSKTTALTHWFSVPPVPRRRRLMLLSGLGLAALAIGLLVAALAGAFRSRIYAPPATTDPGTSAPGSASTDTLRGQAGSDPAPSRRSETPPVREFTLTGHHSQVQSLAFTADSRTLVGAEYGGAVLFWDINHRKLTFQMRTGRELHALAVDPQGRWLAIGHNRPEISLFRFGEAQEEGQLKGHTDRVNRLLFLKDGRTLFSTGFDGSIRSWDVAKREEGKPLRPPGRRLDDLDVWEDGRGGLRLALIGYRDDGFGFVALDDMELERLSTTPGRAALAPDGTRLACTTGENNGVVVWELGSQNRRLGLLVEAPFPRALAFTPDSKHLLVAGMRRTLIYAMTTRQSVAHVDHPEQALSLAVSPDGRWLAVGTLKGLVRVWHLPSLLASPD